MFFIAISALCLVLAFLQVRIGIFGRVVCLLSAAWNGAYGIAVVTKQAPPGIGVLARYLNLDPSPLSPVATTGLLSTALAITAVVAYRRETSKLLLNNINIRVPDWLSWLALLSSTFSTLYVFITIGPSNIFLYTGYGAIKSLILIYNGHPFGLLIASALRPILIVTVLLSTIWVSNRNYRFAVLSLLPISLGIMIGLAESGRIVSVYFGVASIGFFVNGRRALAVLCAALSVVAIAYALEGRSHQTLGLSQTTTFLGLALGNEKIFEDVLTNVAAGQFVTSASVEVATPESYDPTFKALSFMPTIDMFDGFQTVKHYNEQRITGFIPFNAFAEAYLFGPAWFTLFWGILFTCVLCVNSSYVYGRVFFGLLLSVFCLAWSYATQYPLRNSLRYFYFIIAVRLLTPVILDWWRRRGLLARPSPRRTIGIPK